MMMTNHKPVQNRRFGRVQTPGPGQQLVVYQRVERRRSAMRAVATSARHRLEYARKSLGGQDATSRPAASTATPSQASSGHGPGVEQDRWQDYWRNTEAQLHTPTHTHIQTYKQVQKVKVEISGFI